MKQSKQELKYPINLFDNDDYSVVINENQTATLTNHHGSNLERIIDISCLSKAAVLSSYINDKQLLYSFIIVLSNADVCIEHISGMTKVVDRYKQNLNMLNKNKAEMLEKMRRISNETI